MSTHDTNTDDTNENLLLQYFDSMENPTLEHFVEAEICKLTHPKEIDIKRYWTRKYKLVAESLNKKIVLGNPNWYQAIIELTNKHYAVTNTSVSSEITVLHQTLNQNSPTSLKSRHSLIIETNHVVNTENEDLLPKTSGKRNSTAEIQQLSSTTSTSPQSSTESTNKRRKKVKEYLCGNGVISTIELKESCDQFRSEVIEHTKAGSLEIYLQELALNCIFLIDGLECETSSCLQYGFDEEEWGVMLKEVNELYPVRSLDDNVMKTIFEFAEAGDTDFGHCRSIIKKIPDDFIGDDNSTLKVTNHEV
ncbi:hypothetical protein BDC45DRAFT_563259 [Circinella umbellata]|nr:hypothetical protein BDC45DRAFT_563259 [Circinella umbellata]